MWNVIPHLWQNIANMTSVSSAVVGIWTEAQCQMCIMFWGLGQGGRGAGGQWVSGPGTEIHTVSHLASTVWCLLYSAELDRCLYFRKDLPMEQFRHIKGAWANARWAAFKKVTIWRILHKASRFFYMSECALLGVVVVFFSELLWLSGCFN